MRANDTTWDAATEAVVDVPESSRALGFRLEVVQGPDLGLVVLLDASCPDVLVGKSPACEVKLSDPTVSRRHVSLDVGGDRLRLKDLGSTNGTTVNGLRVHDVDLGGGETIAIGRTSLRVDAVSAPTPRLEPHSSFGQVLGASLAMQRLYPLCERLAASTVPVVIEGETGTGKEQLAHALHESGVRQAGPFVVFDCTTVAPSLVESELFGHERGAFTGAVAARRGVFERAHGGTLLIDEIGDFPLELQPKLLRALERGELVRIGGHEPIRVDVRVLAATRRDLDREVQEGRFRDDLYHRLVVTRLALPPLRDRMGDVRLLAFHFCHELGAADLPEKLLRAWEDYTWPGNVRELKNAVARRIALGDLADAADELASIPPPPASARGLLAVARRDDPFAKILTLDLPLIEARQQIVDAFELRYLRHLLEQHAGSVTRAAAAAGVGRRHFYRMLAKLGRPEE